MKQDGLNNLGVNAQLKFLRNKWVTEERVKLFKSGRGLGAAKGDIRVRAGSRGDKGTKVLGACKGREGSAQGRFLGWNSKKRCTMWAITKGISVCRG